MSICGCVWFKHPLFVVDVKKSLPFDYLIRLVMNLSWTFFAVELFISSDFNCLFWCMTVELWSEFGFDVWERKGMNRKFTWVYGMKSSLDRPENICFFTTMWSLVLCFCWDEVMQAFACWKFIQYLNDILALPIHFPHTLIILILYRKKSAHKLS